MLQWAFGRLVALWLATCAVGGRFFGGSVDNWSNLGSSLPKVEAETGLIEVVVGA